MDLDQLRIRGESVALPKPIKAPRHSAGEHFLRGPIPLTWLTHAASAAGRSSGFKVAIALWYLVGLNHQESTVTLTGRALRAFGMDRYAGYRGLAALEAAGLVSVQRRTGQAPRVTVKAVDV